MDDSKDAGSRFQATPRKRNDARSSDSSISADKAYNRLRKDNSTKLVNKRSPASPNGSSGAKEGMLPLTRRHALEGALGIAACLCMGKLGWTQIIDREENLKRGARYLGVAPEAAPMRGKIYDGAGNVLAKSVERYNLSIRPAAIKRLKKELGQKSVDKLLETIAKELDLSRAYVNRCFSSKREYSTLKEHVSKNAFERVYRAAESAGAPEAVMFIKKIVREHPYGSLASQVIGTMSEKTGKKSDADALGTMVGANGLENYYEGALSGSDKKVAEDGPVDVVLSLNMDIQKLAEKVLAQAVDDCSAKTGSVCVMDPSTGAILAAASYPTYDPDDLVHTHSADMQLRLVSDAYEPGSVFKTIITAAGIDMGVINSETEFDVPPTVKVGDDNVSDSDKRDYEMTMTVREILRRSSNTGMVLVGRKIGADAFDKNVIKHFRIGKKSGIDFAGENVGLVKKRKKYDGATLGAMSFGQDLSVAPVEILRAVNAIANGGVAVTPHFAEQVAGEKLDWRKHDQRVMSKGAQKQLVSMMEDVVTSGTGEGAGVDGYTVAGKTGTAQRASSSGGYQEDSFMSSFFGFAPAQDPRVSIYILLDGTPYHSDGVLPAFHTLMEGALSMLGVPKDEGRSQKSSGDRSMDETDVASDSSSDGESDTSSDSQLDGQSDNRSQASGYTANRAQGSDGSYGQDSGQSEG